MWPRHQLGLFYDVVVVKFRLKLFTLVVLHDTMSGLPLGQEKSGKNFLNDKSQEKMGGFEKKLGNLIRF